MLGDNKLLEDEGKKDDEEEEEDDEEEEEWGYNELCNNSNPCRVFISKPITVFEPQECRPWRVLPSIAEGGYKRGVERIRVGVGVWGVEGSGVVRE